MSRSVLHRRKRGDVGVRRERAHARNEGKRQQIGIPGDPHTCHAAGSTGRRQAQCASELATTARFGQAAGGLPREAPTDRPHRGSLDPDVEPAVLRTSTSRVAAPGSRRGAPSTVDARRPASRRGAPRRFPLSPVLLFVCDRIEIVCTDQDKCGHADLLKPIERWWIELLLLNVIPVGSELERPPLHPPNRITDRRFHRPGVSPGPSTHQVRFASTASARSSRAIADRSASKNARKSGVASAMSDPPGAARSSESTCSGLVSATLHGYARPERCTDQVTAPDTEAGQLVEHVINWGKLPMRSFSGLTETTKVQPDNIAYGGECRPLRVPHAAIGDACMDEDNGQVTARTGAVVRDASGRYRGRIQRNFR